MTHESIEIVDTDMNNLGAATLDIVAVYTFGTGSEHCDSRVTVLIEFLEDVQETVEETPATVESIEPEVKEEVCSLTINDIEQPSLAIEFYAGELSGATKSDRDISALYELALSAL